MKIAEIEAFPVIGRWAFVRIRTDDGLEGWGECSLEGRARTVCTQVDELSRRIVGMDARRIEAIWQFCSRSTFYRGGPVLMSAISGIDIALWDLLGKSLGVPVHVLLGGQVRDRVRVYRGLPGEGDSLEEKIALLRRQGLNAFKTGICDQTDVVEGAAFFRGVRERAESLRAAAGDEIDIMFDVHGRVSPAVAIGIAREVEGMHPLFLEEPCLPENVPAMGRIAKASPVPIATGERLFTRFGFREILERQAAAVIQPDLCHAGGISEGRKIAACAETYYVGVAPHNPLGPISTAACLQLDAVAPNFVIQELASLGEGLLRNPFVIEDGHIAVPQGPGLGIDVDVEAVRARGFQDWDNPVFEAPDGSLRDW